MPPTSPKLHLRRLLCGNKIGPGYYESQEIWKLISKPLKGLVPIIQKGGGGPFKGSDPVSFYTFNNKDEKKKYEEEIGVT